MSILYGQFGTPLGAILVAAENDHVIRVAFSGGKHSPSIGPDWIEAPQDPLLASACRQIGEYLSGKRRIFTLPVATAGTPFQHRVWEILQGIPYGKTVSYREMAHLLGKNDHFVRAVASAIARNPVMLLVPCHRVIGSDGSLVGYAGGLDRKKALLEIERTLRPTP
jgi:methylated-DNA-[protein]-cysteine S-methyltransferase